MVMANVQKIRVVKVEGSTGKKSTVLVEERNYGARGGMLQAQPGYKS
jgi:hypothetical protein